MYFISRRWRSSSSSYSCASRGRSCLRTAALVSASQSDNFQQAANLKGRWADSTLSASCSCGGAPPATLGRLDDLHHPMLELRSMSHTRSAHTRPPMPGPPIPRPNPMPGLPMPDLSLCREPIPRPILMPPSSKAMSGSPIGGRGRSCMSIRHLIPFRSGRLRYPAARSAYYPAPQRIAGE